MKALRKSWNDLAARYAAFSMRERRLIAAVAILGPLLAGYTLVVEPQFIRAKNLRGTVEQQQATTLDLNSQLANLRVQVQADPDAPKRAELTALQRQLEVVDERLKKLQDSLVRPEDMNALLGRLLAKHSGLRLVSLKTLPPESILGSLLPADGKPAPVRHYDIYRHGVELQLEGSYLEMLAYLDQLEKAEKKILWGALRFSVIEYPKSQLTVTVHTLGTDKAWLAL